MKIITFKPNGGDLVVIGAVGLMVVAIGVLVALTFSIFLTPLPVYIGWRLTNWFDEENHRLSSGKYKAGSGGWRHDLNETYKLNSGKSKEGW